MNTRLELDFVLVTFLVVLAGSLALVGAGPGPQSPRVGNGSPRHRTGISTLWFSHGHRDKHDKDCDIGWFSHSYVDCYGGLVVLHGTSDSARGARAARSNCISTITFLGPARRPRSTLTAPVERRHRHDAIV